MIGLVFLIFWPLSFPSENFGGHGKKVYRIPRTRFRRSDAVANAIGYAMHDSRSHDAVIRVYDAVGNVIDTHEHAGDFQRAVSVRT